MQQFTVSFQVLLWVLPSILAALGIGAYLGQGLALRSENNRIRCERENIFLAMQKFLASAEELTNEVDSHNSELESVGRSVGDIDTSGGLEEMQIELLTQIANVMESNRRLEDDLVCTRYQLEEQAQELDRTRLEARMDNLSGVSNRKAFDERLQYMVSDFKRKGNPFALLFADVDHFKWINDTHGHQSGDRVVALLGKTLAECLRGNDHVSRYGGDEFAILLAMVSVHDAEQVAIRIRDKVQQTNFDVGAGGGCVAVALSMGLHVSQEGDTAEAIIHRADQALYKSKTNGRNQLNVWDADEYTSDDPVEPHPPVEETVGEPV